MKSFGVFLITGSIILGIAAVYAFVNPDDILEKDLYPRMLRATEEMQRNSGGQKSEIEKIKRDIEELRRERLTKTTWFAAAAGVLFIASMICLASGSSQANQAPKEEKTATTTVRDERQSQNAPQKVASEKLILETLANHTDRLAGLQYALAGLMAVIESRLPDLSPEQKDILQKSVEIQKKDAETLKSGAERIRQALEKL